MTKTILNNIQEKKTTKYDVTEHVLKISTKRKVTICYKSIIYHVPSWLFYEGLFGMCEEKCTLPGNSDRRLGWSYFSIV